MHFSFFELFANTLDRIPSKGLRRAVELEKFMLEEDLSRKRFPRDRDVDSVLAFCKLIGLLESGDDPLPLTLPVAHIAYYRSLITRMIEAGELTTDASERFDNAFGPSFWRMLKSN